MLYNWENDGESRRDTFLRQNGGAVTKKISDIHQSVVNFPFSRQTKVTLRKLIKTGQEQHFGHWRLWGYVANSLCNIVLMVVTVLLANVICLSAAMRGLVWNYV